jgi:hypothetical protein
MVDPIVPRSIAPRPALGRRRGPGRVLAFVALAGFFVAGVVLVVTGLSHRGASDKATTTVAAPAVRHPVAPQPRPKPVHHVAAVAIHVAGVGAYDPKGDGQENDSEAPLATDGDATTFWHTEHYHSWYKPGVGLVLDAGKAVKPASLTLRTDTPGFVADIEAGPGPKGPFTRVSASKTATATTVYRLKPTGAARYLVVWITNIQSGGAADVNEVRVRQQGT